MTKFLLKISPQNQISLNKRMREELGSPSHIEVEVVNGNLVVRPAHKLTLEEAERRYRRHGITAEVLEQAFRLVRARQAAQAVDGAVDGTAGPLEAEPEDPAQDGHATEPPGHRGG